MSQPGKTSQTFSTGKKDQIGLTSLDWSNCAGKWVLFRKAG